MFIRTARLFLRPCWPEDRHEMLALIGEGAPAPNAPALPWPLTAGDTQRFIDRPGDRLLPHFFITLPGSPGTGLIGGIGLGRDGGEVGLGYWIAAAHRGHGYAAEAIRGKPLGQRAQEYGFRLGLALVLTLMVFATWNDLANIRRMLF